MWGPQLNVVNRADVAERNILFRGHPLVLLETVEHSHRPVHGRDEQLVGLIRVEVVWAARVSDASNERLELGVSLLTSPCEQRHRRL